MMNLLSILAVPTGILVIFGFVWYLQTPMDTPRELRSPVPTCHSDRLFRPDLVYLNLPALHPQDFIRACDALENAPMAHLTRELWLEQTLRIVKGHADSADEWARKGHETLVLNQIVAIRLTIQALELKLQEQK
jgi:hypothetical protein